MPSDASQGVITGFGVQGYLVALDGMLNLLKQRANVRQFNASSGTRRSVSLHRSAGGPSFRWE